MFEMKFPRFMMGVTRWDKFRNDEIQRRVEIEETFAQKVDRRVLQ